MDTLYGPIHVTVMGDRRKWPMVTVHEVGATWRESFQSLLVAHARSSLLLSNFCFYHINVPGHEVRVPSRPRVVGV